MGYFQLLELYREFLETSETLPPEAIDKMVQHLERDFARGYVEEYNDYVSLFYDKGTIGSNVDYVYDWNEMSEVEKEGFDDWVMEVSDDLSKHGNSDYYDKASDAWADYAYDQM